MEGPVTFKEAIDIALADIAAELQPTGLATWRSHARGCLKYWGEDRELTTVTRVEIQKWIHWRAKSVKASTIGHERSLLSRLWRILEDRGLDLGLQCPLSRLRMPKKRTEKRQISAEVLEQVEAIVSEHDGDLINLTLLTFMRRLEVFRLRPQDVIIVPDPDNPGQFLFSLRIETSKTGKGRMVPLNDQAVEIALRRLKVAEEEGLTYLFGSQLKDRFKAACQWAKQVWHPLIKKIGKGGHFHGLRHRGAHLAWKNGAPIEATSRMLGHSNIPQTEHYIGVPDDTMILAARAVGKGMAQRNVPANPEPIPTRRNDSAWLGF